MIDPKRSSPKTSITAPTTMASAATFAGSAGSRPCFGQHAARRQRDRAGERRHHQHGAGENRGDDAGHDAGVQADDGVESADAGVGHALGDREQSGHEPGQHVARRGPAEAAHRGATLDSCADTPDCGAELRRDREFSLNHDLSADSAAVDDGTAQNGGWLAIGSRWRSAAGVHGDTPHIGVIDELHERGYEIVGIAGSSMGALVGGLQAAGKLDEFAEWAKSLTQRAVLRLLDPSITAAGVLRAAKILDAVRDILGEVTIEELPIPYTAVTTDLIAGKSVWLQRGPVDAAIRASIAIPGVITPHILDGRLLADGGILDPLPMAPIAAVNADLTIAVSLSGSEAGGRYEPTDAEPRATTEWLNRMWRSTSSLFERTQLRSAMDTPTGRDLSRSAVCPTTTTPTTPDGGSVPKMGSFEVMNRTIDIAQAALARHTLAAYPPDLLIEVPRTACRSLEFHRAAEVIDIGHELDRQHAGRARRFNVES